MFIRIVSMLFLLMIVSCSGEIYKNNRYSAEKRADDLLQRMTLEEKVLLMTDRNIAIERLGMNEYNWWNEALHGVARAGSATVFPQPIAMGATFDTDMVLDVFNAIADEARAKHSFFSTAGEYDRYQGLTMWTPTINIFRDPRWGRGMESYGEDPYLTGSLGAAVVNGLQGSRLGGYDKLLACAKHYAVHSGPEWNRHSFDAKNISPRDLHETYLPAFKTLVKDANVGMVMCAYNRFEGVPCCNSDQLLVDILRNEWGFDGIVVSDCGAIRDFYDENAHATHPDAASASADAVLSGTDLDCGSSYRSLTQGVEKGYINEKDIDVSVKRLLKARFELGEMDSNDKVEWTSIPYSVVGSAEHDKLALEVARRSMTLLYNKDDALPLERGGLKVAVMGPNSNDSVMQWGNYNGTPPHTITILEGIRQALRPDDHLIYEKGNEWVERTIMESAFNLCSSGDNKGFSATYWNNTEMEGDSVSTVMVATPFHFCTSGATVFAPGVDLTGFSARYTGAFKPEKTGEVFMQFYINGLVSVYINGEKVRDYKTNHGSRKQEHKFKVDAGKVYDIEIHFAYYRPDAELNFDLGYKKEINIQQSVDRVKDADVVVYVSGISPSLEGEEMGVRLPGFHRGDRTDIELPAIQKEMLQALHKAGKRIILVNCSGSAMAFTDEVEICDAILQAWYPGQAGGLAVADVLFGNYNPAGRLPVTFYKNSDQLPDFENYDMKNRTYRYFDGEALFPFGFGLSYSTFTYGTPKFENVEVSAGQVVNLLIPVSNSGQMDGEEVVQVYIKKKSDPQGPILTLRAYQRIFIGKGETVNVEFDLPATTFEWWDDAIQRMDIKPGEYEVFVGSSSRMEDLQKLTIHLN